MKIRRFQEFNEDAAKAGEFKKKFSSPLYVSQDWEGFWEKQMRDKDPKEFNDKAEDLGWDFSEAYSNWEQDHDDDKFWEACNKIISPNRGAGFYSNKERLENTGIEADEIKNIVIDSFNEDDLAQYAKDRVPTLTSLKALDVDVSGMFKVEATFSEEPNEEVIKKTKEYLAGQYSDGWGEGFEQQEQKGNDEDQPDYYINAWAKDKDKNWQITVVK